ncbi:MAG TPA: apolipoprotein N-acyltransferase [Caulobacteraceae bacterium]
MKGVRVLSGPAWLALAAGIAAALAHPPFGVLPGILGYGLMFAVVDQTDGERPLRSAFWRAWLAGVAYFSISCWWVAEAFLVDAAEQGWMAPFAVILLAGGLALFWGLGGLLYRALRPRDTVLKVLVFAGALSLLEWTRGHILTGFPWNLPGETWRAGLPPSQAAALVGAYGLTWITLFAMAALAAPFAFGFRRSTWSLLAGGIAVVIGLYAYGFWHLSHGEGPATAGPMVRVVQADVRQESKYDTDKFVEIVNRYLRLTAQPSASGKTPDVVIWPEGAIPTSINELLNRSVNRNLYRALVGALRPGQILLMGTYRLDEKAVRPTYYNSLYALRRDGDDLTVLGVYDKYRLVPFGEYMPAGKLMSAIGFQKLVHVAEEGFTAGPQPRPMLVAGLGLLQPLICYESLFPGFVREGGRLVGGRAAWIVNVSNDAWFGQTSGPWQHLNLASYRAIEEGMPIVRATPTGVSAVIDAEGRPLQLLALGKQGVIDAPLPGARLQPTVFARYGETAFWIMIALSAVALIPAVRQRSSRARLRI